MVIPDVVEVVEVPAAGSGSTGSGRAPTSGPGLGLHVRRWHGRDRRPVLLVHGLASNARLWDGVAVELAGAGHPVAAIDLRGHGRSDAPDDGYEVATVAGDVRSVVEALGWDGPVVAGQSWGGNVVLELAARWPALAVAVAGIDGGTIELHRSFPTWERCADALAPPQLAGTPLADVERHLRRAHPDWPDSGIEGQLGCFRVHDDGTISPRLSRERHMLALRGLWEHRPADAYPAIQVPVLLLGAEPAGESHEAKVRAVEEAAASIGRCRVEWMRGDHDLHAQHPGRVAALLAELAAGTDG